MFVTTLDPKHDHKLQHDLQHQGFELSQPPYTIFHAKKPGVSCTLYRSRKFTVQGKNMREFLEFYLEPEILHAPLYTCKTELALDAIDKRPRIGVDESGKGDYFGPLCIAGVFLEPTHIASVLELGVCDSKKLSDAQIYTIAPKIVQLIPNYIIRLMPKKYNELYSSFRNLNKLLAWGHTTVIENLANQCSAQVAIIDQFAGEHEVIRAAQDKHLTLPIEQRVRGEADLAVAAASIIARWAFLEGLRMLGESINERLPKGASRQVVSTASRIVSQHGDQLLPSLAKIHFTTTKQLSNK